MFLFFAANLHVSYQSPANKYLLRWNQEHMETAEAGEVLSKALDWNCEIRIVEVKSCYEYKP